MPALILTRDEGEQLSSFEGKHVVPIDRDGEYYREWRVSVHHTQYCIINEGDTWTLMYFVPDINTWADAPDDVDTFLATNTLILAA